MTGYGVTLFAGGRGPERFRRTAALARRAEAAGFDTVWVGELYSRSATVAMAALATATTTVRIGSSIAYGVGRTPLIWAAEARDLDELSGGRIVLGLGNGTARMVSDWHGVDGSAPAARMEELVGLLRELWRLHEGPVHHDGRFYRLHITPTSETPAPFRDRLPIWTAAVNPRMLRATGAVADGLIGHPMFTDRYAEEIVRPEVLAGASAAGRDLADVELARLLMCAVDDDVERARDRLRFAIAQYAASRVYDRLFALHGWQQVQAELRTALKARDPQAAARAVPDDVVDEIAIACAPGQLADEVARRAGAWDHIALSAPAWGLSLDEMEHATSTIVDELSAAPVLTGA